MIEMLKRLLFVLAFLPLQLIGLFLFAVILLFLMLFCILYWIVVGKVDFDGSRFLHYSDRYGSGLGITFGEWLGIRF